LPPSAGGAVSGPVVFAGHGIFSARWRYDDYRNADVRGAIVLVLDGAPASVRGIPLASASEKRELASLRHKVAQARARGAAGLLVIRDSPEAARALWHSEEWLLFDRGNRTVVAALSERAANPIRDALKKRVAVTARLSPGVVVAPVVVHNVLSMVEGRGPAGAGMVVVGAHLDHDGTDDAGRVFNGADDNASGVAAVLAMASAFARAAASGDRPARAVVFALWNGEEQGLYGAEVFAAAPRPAREVIANINLDMVGRSEHVPSDGDPRFSGFHRTSASDNANVVHLLGYTYSPDLARLVNRANESVRLKVKQEYDRGTQGLLQRSDQWSFLKRGIPAIFLTTGLHPDYHTPADDADRIEYGKLERITELAARVAWMAADGEPPRFRR
jgi:hypothetical protein